ncbi:hypothetical protein GCM10011335_13640 [Aureimonas glaciei]|uniref:AAA+ ATPase domain-containing protein n=2 Tax=Aureimonas glaciei TaxID=1776957 RepID=A0A917D7L6_9HYPH|nr:hypothetical protein GCM10011335_13640 [Aureimonas glaciei]
MIDWSDPDTRLLVGGDEVTFRIAQGQDSLGRVKNKTFTLPELSKRLTTPHHTPEQFADFLALEKPDQDRLKNATGFWMGGHCKAGRRNREGMSERDVLTLDADTLTPAQFATLKDRNGPLMDVLHILHTTRKHTPEAPRVRIVIPLKRPVQSEKYGPLGRIVAEMIDPTMDSIDDVSFRTTQMMFWPTASADAEFVGEYRPGPMLDPDEVFASFRASGRDPTNHADLPFSAKQGKKRQSAEKASDPREKEGIVGEVCRAMSIEEVFAEHLFDTYTPGKDGRWSFIGGSTANGVVFYDEVFAFSHHSTDPLSDRLVNAFEAIRLVKFSYLDADTPEDTPPGAMPSFHAMADFARSLPAVRAIQREEMFEVLPDDEEDVPGEVPAGLRFYSPDDCFDMPSRGYVWKGMLAPGDLACVFGEPGAGKSLLAPHIGYAIAQGRPCFGKRTKQGGVFYVAAEDEHGMRGRVAALRKRHGPADQFFVVGGLSSIFAAESPDLTALRKAVKASRPAVIIIDTLAMAFPGLEENEAAPMMRVVAIGRKLTEFGAAVIFVHHPAKGGETPRGFGGFDGAMDMTMFLKRDDKLVRGHLKKNRNGSPDADIAFTIGTIDLGEDEDGDPRSIAYAKELPAGSEPKEQRLPPSAGAALTELVRLTTNEGVPLPNDEFGIPEDRWRQECIDGRTVSTSDTEDSRRRAFGRAAGELVAKGRIGFLDGCYFTKSIHPPMFDRLDDEHGLV